MYGRFTTAISSFLLAVVILLVSVTRAASVRYVFSQSATPMPTETREFTVDYVLPFDEDVSTHSPKWLMESVRDRISTAISGNANAKAQDILSMADKRLVAAWSYCKDGDWSRAISLFAKSEHYLDATKNFSFSSKDLQSGFLYTLADASLKHREVLEEAMLTAPEDAKPIISKMLNTPKVVFNEVNVEIARRGGLSATNPFSN